MSEPSPAPEIAGYRLEGQLGQGGFGTVWAAVRLEDGRAAALKLVPGRGDAEERTRFEAELLRRAHTAPVPRVFEVRALGDDQLLLALERIELPPLPQLMAERPGPWSLTDFSSLMLPLLEGVAELHRVGIIHRDLKPENLFADLRTGAVRVIDLGIALAVGFVPEHVPAAAVEAGTPDYLAPEQAEGKGEIDARADLYSLGVLAYRLLTGAMPFTGTVAELLQQHQARRPPPLSRAVTLPAALEAWVLRLLEKDPSARFPDAEKARRALESVLADAAPTSLGAAAVAPSHLSAAPAAAPAAAPRKVMMALVFLEGVRSSSELSSRVAALGGKVGHLARTRAVVLLESGASAKPAALAFEIAQILVTASLARAAVVDLGTVTVVERKLGAAMYASPLFSRAERYPPVDGPSSVEVTAQIAALLPELGFTARTPDGARLGSERTQVPLDARATSLRTTTTHLIGRDAELRALVVTAERAVAGSALGLLVVEGESGTGKSELAAASFEQLKGRFPGGTFFSLRAPETQWTGHELSRGLLAFALALPLAPPDDAGRGLVLARLGSELGEQLWPAVAVAMGFLSPQAPEARHLAAVPGLARRLTARALAEALLARAGEGPLFLFVDDAQAADEISLDAVEQLARSGRAVPLVLGLFGRHTEVRPLSQLGEGAAHRTFCTLGPLSSADAGDLLRQLLAPAQNIPANVIAQLSERSGSVPGAMVELARGLKGAGVLRRSAERDHWYLATDQLENPADLPQVEWLVQRELAALAPELRAHAQLAALLGADFTLAEMRAVLRVLESSGQGERFPLDARVGLRRLREREVVTESRESAEHFRFRTALFRDALLATLTPEQRRPLHDAAFLAYRTLAQEDPLLESRLALHAEKSDRAEVALDLWLQLAQRAQARHGYLAADILFSRALPLVTAVDSGRLLRVLRGRGLMRYRLGRYEDALADYARACEEAKAAHDDVLLADLLFDQATALDWMDEYHRSRSSVEAASALLTDVPSPLMKARLHMAQGRSQLRFAEYPAAVPSLTEAVALAQSLGDEAYETLVASLLMLAPLLAFVGEMARAEQVFTQAIELTSSLGDLVHLGTGYQNRVVLQLLKRDAPSALADGERFLEISRELGMLGSEYRAESNLAELEYQRGNCAGALPHLERALTLRERFAGAEGRPDMLLLRARIHLFEGKLELARAQLAAIEAHQAGAGAGALLLPPEQILLRMVRLGTNPVLDATAWETLIADATQLASQTDPIEVQEMAGLAHLRATDPTRALSYFRAAEATARTVPNLMGPRLEAHVRMAAD